MTSGPPVPGAAQDAFERALLEDDPEQLYERAPCGYLSTTPDGTIVKVNETFLRWTGFERDALVGRRRFVDLLTAGGRIYHETHYAPMLRMQDSALEIALDVVKADGALLSVLVNAVLVRDRAGEPAVVRVAIFDATDRRNYERELLREKERAEESEARARTLARTLQQTFIPPTPPDVPGLDVAAVYRPAGTGEEVGGDFYDVFQVGAEEWVVVLGDVCGKGVEAAVVTALVRYSVRAVTARLPGPADALSALNDVVLGQGSDRFCTVVLLRLRREPPGWRVTVSAGGHPLPFLVRPGEEAVQVGEPGSLVGVLEQVHFSDTEVRLGPGSMLLLFTDGVTEARRGREQYGLERLALVAGAGHDSALSLTTRLLEDVLEFEHDRPRDDVAVVAVRVPEEDGFPPGQDDSADRVAV